MLVLGCSENPALRKAGNSDALGYGFLTAPGNKHFAVVGLPSHHSGCIETNGHKSRYSECGKESFNCSPARDDEETK